MPYPFWTAPEPEDIYHIPTGLKLSFDGMMDMVAGSVPWPLISSQAISPP